MQQSCTANLQVVWSVYSINSAKIYPLLYQRILPSSLTLQDSNVRARYHILMKTELRRQVTSQRTLDKCLSKVSQGMCSFAGLKEQCLHWTSAVSVECYVPSERFDSCAVRHSGKPSCFPITPANMSSKHLDSFRYIIYNLH